MAIRRRRLAGRVVGLSRSALTAKRAKRLGAVDGGTTNAQEAVRDADLVVLATPVETIVPVAQRLARWMKPGSVLTDVGSAKASIVQALERSLPRHVAFVGGHPIAGSERRGLAAADPRLFDGSVCVLTPTRRTSRPALRRVASLWKPLVGRLVAMDPARHDRLLAQTSHLTHLLAFSLARAVSTGGLPEAPRSFLDATRMAKSDPSLWDDIFFTNRREVLRAMDAFEREWRAARRLLARTDRAGLRRFLAQAKARRDALD
ncbi:MAG: prephenate dehydrogenase/arogenate dehydrogenase family protein [Candidatus Omnitrophica bacterium]|nr:prephenate dehydrogenase/arogenate dehydrogenase family protein [Candidatus Omnitrophota bacterium]